MNDKSVSEAKEHARQLLDIEEKYTQAIKQVKYQQEKIESDAANRNYNIQLSKAKTAIQAEKIKQDRIDDLKKSANDKYLESLKIALDAEIKQRDKQFRDLKYSLDMGVISEQEYYSDLARLRDCYFDEGSEEWQRYSLQIADYNRSIIENTKAAIIEILSETADKIDKAKDKVSGNLEEYINLFDTVKATYKKAGPYGSDFIITKTSLANLEEQTTVLKKYHDAILAVKERGEIPEELFIQLRELDVEDGLKFADTLLSATDTEFQEYIEAFKLQQETIKQIAQDLTQNETDKAIAQMKAKLEEVYGDVPEGFWECGADSASNFGDAFIEGLEDVFGQIKKVIESNISEIMPMLSGNTTENVNNSYSASYNFYGSGESVAGQLQAARAAAVVERMRGGYDI